MQALLQAVQVKDKCRHHKQFHQYLKCDLVPRQALILGLVPRTRICFPDQIESLIPILKLDAALVGQRPIVCQLPYFFGLKAHPFA